ncbi:isochorismatase family protein [Chitinimonas koreensis]|uniref:isochorismatase family protein n=1 Tax=Chitinimonas koreensis TaxID=356302 RepID=UPI0004110657|nr:isochorismatase family protein [Chitinimonas koreensis]QNM98036.1 isochorismatase family protein [Chitinimonas koreensis]
MLMHADNSTLLVVDVQDKLVPAIADAPRTVAAMKWLVDAARMNGVPVVLSEQYPQGLGHTLGLLRAAAESAPTVEKTTFSCVAADCLKDTPAETRSQVVICGIEAHVCVLQTALELQAAGKQVFLVADAIGARQAADKAVAIERARTAGVAIVTREMALFEWMRDSRVPQFREASKQLLQAAPSLPFQDALACLPRIDHIGGMQLWREGKLEAIIENRPGQAGSLAIYHALYRDFGAITPKAARLGQWLYGEHAEDARKHPGKHPNIDRLFSLEVLGGGYGVRLMPH